MFIPNVEKFNGLDLKDVELDELVEYFSSEALSQLLVEGGLGLKKALAGAVGHAYSKGLQERS